ncbi:MAG: hypothetical protein AAB730_00735 [Patescibacteria group bacterium]
MVAELQKIKAATPTLKVGAPTPKGVGEEAAEESPETPTQGRGSDRSVGEIKGVVIQRYKGLGEMNPAQLWETTMNPQTRVMKQVNVENAAEAARIFAILMGDEVLPRKKFIQTHAKAVKNLDI